MIMHSIKQRLLYSLLFRILPAQARFSLIHKFNLWGSAESISGPGSELCRTFSIRQALPSLFKAYQIKSILDIPCGDFNWMSRVELGGLVYTGADIIPALIAGNNSRFKSANLSFVQLDILRDKLPRADLVIVRDLLIHFSHANAAKALASIYQSGSTYMLATTYPGTQQNLRIRDGFNYNINLQVDPFHLPAPLLMINEAAENRSNSPSMGLWAVQDLSMFSPSGLTPPSASPSDARAKPR